MKRSLKSAAETLASGRRRAYVSRVAWLDLERLVTAAYDELAADGSHAAELGNLYLTSNRNYPPFNKPHFSAVNVINQIQVHAGWRQLNVSHAISENGESRAEPLAESGATLWFSQDATGLVMAFVAPYNSKAMRMNEENIILARYSCASAVSARDVRRHFATYFRYCAITSAHGCLGLGGYLYRLRLKYNDFRFASEMRASVFRYVEPLLAAVGIVATLYAGNKLLA